VLEKEQKGGVLAQLLADHDGPILVFSRTRHGARKVAKSLRGQGHTAAEIHSDRSMGQRRTALDGFKNGAFRILVATDIAARGIDVKRISLVINYDLPASPEDYLHRIGRTGRAGHTGKAITLATPEQSKDVHAIKQATREPLPLSKRYA
jgi:ATP-dependent RNA helicase RhlE